LLHAATSIAPDRGCDRRHGAGSGAWRHGYDLLKELDLKAGTLYPILMRLCDRGVLEATWEADPPAGRPPRHLYRLKGGVAPAPRPEPGMVPAW